MSEIIYLDTNVIMDYFLDRDSAAWELLLKTNSCAYTIVVSDLVISELDNNSLLEPMSTLIDFLSKKNKIRIELITSDDRKNAKAIDAPGNDSLHAAIALRLGVNYFVTKNLKDFRLVNGLKVRGPKEIC